MASIKVRCLSTALYPLAQAVLKPSSRFSVVSVHVWKRVRVHSSHVGTERVWASLQPKPLRPRTLYLWLLALKSWFSTPQRSLPSQSVQLPALVEAMGC